MLRFIFLIVAAAMSYCCQAESAESVSYDDFVKNKSRVEGFFDLLIDETSGDVYLEIDKSSQFIFQSSLPWGLGSNDIGLDRGQLGKTALVVFERIGKKVLMRQLNTRYRATSDNPAERASVEQAFASSVIHGFSVVAERSGSFIVDYTPFLLSDIHNIAERLKARQEGDYSIDESRSAAFFGRIKGFPRNTELESIVTFTSKASPKPGAKVTKVSPDPKAVSVHLHHSLIALPDDHYEPRAFHPRSGYFPRAYVDYSAPIDQDMVKRLIARHRLKKKDREAAASEAVEPIIYYLDPGVPEPVRSALMEGASWWNQAFEAAGFINAFQVKMLPLDADPMDVRYNIIQWVHRNTRGWSYGMSVRDPRTAEILKGHVSLGSLRVRQDMRIAQGLLSPYGDDSRTQEIRDMSLARIRQLSAHEVGHTLGLVHNYAASTDDRASVMDYPHPRLKLNARGEVDLSDAYAVGIGEWDKLAIAYGYTEFGEDEEARGLEEIIKRADRGGLKFITDADSRPAGSAHPDGHLWDDGSDIVEGLKKTLAVRKVALESMGENTLPDGTPYSELGEVFVPIFYLHRYQLEAAIKLIGGLEYSYAVKGDAGSIRVAPVAATWQNRALDLIVTTLSIDVLETPSHLLDLIAPKVPGYPRDRESPPGLTLPAFDPITLAEAGAEETLRLLLNSARLARVAQQHARDQDLPGIRELLDRIRSTTLDQEIASDLTGEISKRVNLLVIEHLLSMVYEIEVPEVSASAAEVLVDVQRRLKRRSRRDQLGHYAFLLGIIARADEMGSFTRRKGVARIPPGSPI